MKINSITLNNFKAYSTKKTFEFNEGINLIQGHNGKGKSTLLDVINLLIFNKTPDNTESLCNWNSKKKFFNIAIDFDHDSDNYRVAMSYEKKGNSGTSERTLEKNGKVIASNSEVNKYFEELFDIPTMTYALISGQRKAEIVECQDSERRELLKKIQNLDYSKQVKNNIEPHIAELKERIEAIEKEIYLLENKEYSYQATKELPFNSDKYKVKKIEVGKLKERISKLTSDLSMVEHYKAEIEKIETILNDKKQELADLLLEKDNFNKDRISEIEKELEGLNVKRKDIQSQIDSFDEDKKLQIKKDELDKELNSIDKEIELLKESDVLKARLTRVKSFDEESYEKNKEDLVRIFSKKEQLEYEIKQLKDGICPLCKKPSEKHEDDHREAELVQLKENIVKIEQTIEEKENEKKSIEEQKKSNEDLKEQKRQVEQNIEKKVHERDILFERNQSSYGQYKQSLTESYRELKERLDDNNRSIESLTKEKENFVKELSLKEETININIERIKKDIETNDKTFADLNEAKKSIQKSSLELPTVKQQLSLLEEEVRNYEVLVSEIERIEESNRVIKKQETDDKKLLNNKQKDFNKILEEKNDYQLAKDILLKDFPNFVIDTKIDEIEYDMNQFIDQIYDKELNIKFKKNKSSIKLVYGNTGISVKGGASGAERKLCQLAFINSFNQQLDLNCLILDEPGESADSNNTNKMYNLLGSMEEVYKQLIVITHKEEMKEYLIANYDANVIEV